MGRLMEKKFRKTKVARPRLGTSLTPLTPGPHRDQAGLRTGMAAIQGRTMALKAPNLGSALPHHDIWSPRVFSPKMGEMPLWYPVQGYTGPGLQMLRCSVPL